MKVFYAIFAIAVAVSCMPLDFANPYCPPRLMTEAGMRPKSVIYDFGQDTTVLISAVRYPASYDWRRDSLAGAVECNVVLYENLREKLSFPAGPLAEVSPDPDMHHILDGHLYTEYSGAAETVVKRDGEEILRFEGREYLKGLLATEGGIYTLSRDRGSEAFTLRKDGRILFSGETGAVLDGFDDWIGSPTGALREDEGHIFFFYTGRAAGKYFWNMVLDGQDVPLKLLSDQDRLVDALLAGGIVHYIYEIRGIMYYYDGNRYWHLTPRTCLYWVEPRLVRTTRGIEVFGECCLSGGTPGLYSYFREEFTRLGDAGAVPYLDGDGIVSLNHGRDGTLSIRRDGVPAPAPKDTVYCFMNSAAFSGGRSFLALSPRTSGEASYLWVDGRKYRVGINGCLTGISVEKKCW